MDVSGILDAAQFLALLPNSVQTCEQSQAQLKACAEEADIMLLIQKTEADIVAVGLVEKDLGEWLRTAKQAFKEFNAAARRGGLDRRRKNTAEQRRLLSPSCKTVPSAVHSILYDDLADAPHNDHPLTVHEQTSFAGVSHPLIWRGRSVGCAKWSETMTPRLAGTEALQLQCGQAMDLEGGATGNLLRFQWGAEAPQ